MTAFLFTCRSTSSPSLKRRSTGAVAGATVMTKGKTMGAAAVGAPPLGRAAGGITSTAEVPYEAAAAHLSELQATP